jgi:hypothetical protein
MSGHQEQLHEELEQIRVALHQMASEARQFASEAPEPSPRASSTGALPPDRNIQVIVEIEARALTVERLFMISERQEWMLGETLEYALDALELALAAWPQNSRRLPQRFVEDTVTAKTATEFRNADKETSR